MWKIKRSHPTRARTYSYTRVQSMESKFQLWLQFRAKVADKFDATVEQICLIFAGKILKDGETLAQHGIKDGLVVHLVVKSVNKVCVHSTCCHFDHIDILCDSTGGGAGDFLQDSRSPFSSRTIERWIVVPGDSQQDVVVGMGTSELFVGTYIRAPTKLEWPPQVWWINSLLLSCCVRWKDLIPAIFFQQFGCRFVWMKEDMLSYLGACDPVCSIARFMQSPTTRHAFYITDPLKIFTETEFFHH